MENVPGHNETINWTGVIDEDHREGDVTLEYNPAHGGSVEVRIDGEFAFAGDWEYVREIFKRALDIWPDSSNDPDWHPPNN